MSATRISEENVGVFSWNPHGNAPAETLFAYVRRQAAKPLKPGSRLAEIDWKGKVVVDLGCGGGWKALPMALRGATVWGVDGSAVQIARAREHARGLELPDAHFVEGMLEEVDQLRLAHGIPDADLVICSAVIHHVGGWRRLVRLFPRLLKPDGYLYLTWGDPTIAWGSFCIKNQIAYRLGRDRESRLRIGRRLFGWWDRRRNTLHLDWDSFFADLYSAYYIPIRAGVMRRELAKASIRVVESYPALDVHEWIRHSPHSRKRRLVRPFLGRVPGWEALCHLGVRLESFFRFEHGPRIFIGQRTD